MMFNTFFNILIFYEWIFKLVYEKNLPNLLLFTKLMNKSIKQLLNMNENGKLDLHIKLKHTFQTTKEKSNSEVKRQKNN